MRIAYGIWVLLFRLHGGIGEFLVFGIALARVLILCRFLIKDVQDDVAEGRLKA